MALFDFSGMKKKQETTQLVMAQFLNSIPIFSQFGDNIYSSDVVQNCITAIADEIKKSTPKHVRINQVNKVREQPRSSINRLFKVSPNPLMTTSDFLEKLVWQLMMNYNAWVWPMYEVYQDNGVSRKRYTGFYPLAPVYTEFQQDANTGKLYVKLRFKKGDEFTLPYDQIIHIRKKFSVNDIMGGGENGEPDNEALLTTLETNNQIIQGLTKGVQSSLGIKGFLKMNTMAKDESQEEEIRKFEEKINNAESGILPLDLKSSFESAKVDPKLVDAETIKYVDKKVSNWFRVSQAILDGDFSEAQAQAFFESACEPILIAFSQAFTAVLFSDREIDVGNEIIFYEKNLMYLTPKTKLDIIKTVGEQGLLTDDQKLELLGYPPIGGEEGARRTQSLNYVDVDLVNDYQMTKAAAPQINGTGGSTNG